MLEQVSGPVNIAFITQEFGCNPHWDAAFLRLVFTAKITGF